MALDKATIKTEYPIPLYNYRVEIDGEAASFSEVSGLSISYETYTYKESPVEAGAPGPRTFHMPAQRGDSTVTLKKGLVAAVSIPLLYEWLNTVQINQIVKKDIIVRLLDEAGAPRVSWKINNAFPTKLDAPTFDATSNDAAIETMELKADSISIEES